jgi:hypothetical protein
MATTTISRLSALAALLAGAALPAQVPPDTARHKSLLFASATPPAPQWLTRTEAGQLVRIGADSTAAQIGPRLRPIPSRLALVDGSHVVAGLVLLQQAHASWGRSNGPFHVKNDWSGDGLLQNDEASHFTWAYALTRNLSRAWRWAGVAPRRARTYAALETAAVMTFVEFPLDALNPSQGMGISDLIFDYAGVGMGLLAASHPGRWDFKVSVKHSLFGRRTLFAQTDQESDNYLFWFTYRPPILWERQPVSVGVGHSVRRPANGGSPVRELYLGIGTTIPDLLRSVAPRAAHYVQLLEVFFINVHLRATVR